MLRNPLTPAHGVPLMVTIAYLAALLVLLTGRRVLIGVAGLSERALTCVAGYLRPHSDDPWLEIRLRDAFAEFDRDIKVFMHD